MAGKRQAGQIKKAIERIAKEITFIEGLISDMSDAILESEIEVDSSGFESAFEDFSIEDLEREIDALIEEFEEANG